MNEHDLKTLYELWLGSQQAPKTKAAYELSWKSLRKFTSNKPIGELRRMDLLAWSNDMLAKKKAPKTVNLRLTAVNSYFKYVEKCMGAPVENPAHNLPRPRNQPVRETYFLTADECKRLLSSINRATVQGMRDFALYLAYLLLGRRNSEVRNLTYGDFTTRSDGSIWYRWSGKGKRNQVVQCPPPVYEAILAYLRAAGSLEGIQAADYIFEGGTPGSPLSSRQVGFLLKQYAAAIGIDPKRIHVHALRHTFAVLRFEAGATMAELQRILGHSQASTTDIYVRAMTGQGDATWGSVADQITT